MPTIQKILSLSPVLPVVTLENPDDAIPVAEALLEGGIRLIEITLRTEAALHAIETLAKKHTGITIGAGTVLDRIQFKQAVDAGAEFVVSPGMTLPLLATSCGVHVPYLPGVATASEIMLALEQKFTYLKFFPAESNGGAVALKHFASVFPHIKFCPTGGITPENALQYRRLSNVICIGGSWIVPKEAILAKDWKHITANALAATKESA